MAINPNSTIQLFAGVPLDSGYSDTFDFASLSAQNAYFSTLTPVKTFTANSYQRVNEGVFRAQCLADEIYQCNYMRFQNTAHGSKWFYAFVNSVEYENEGTAIVRFEIDVLQTYFVNDITLEQCFVERQHTITDEIGDNIQPEPVQLGEYVYADYQQLIPRIALWDCVIAIAICDTGTADVNGVVYDNVYGGVSITVFPATEDGATNASAFLAQYIQRPDSVVNMYMLPRFAVGDITVTDEGLTLENSFEGAHISERKTALPATASFDGYQPVNKKLFTYPYNFLQIDNANGSSLPLRYEFFTDLRPSFKVETTVSYPPQVKLIPFNYKGSGSTPLQTETLTIDAFPLCSWNNDTYRAWVAQNGTNMAVSLGVGLGSLAVGAITGGVGLVAGVVAGVTQVANTLKQEYSASIQADTCRGNTSSANVTFSNKELDFHGGRCHVTREQAIVIDNFFKMFGYAVNKVVKPNHRARPHYTYVKTIDCKLHGNAPTSALRKICDIFNNGVTFWRVPSEIGNYSVDNRPSTT